MVYSPLISDDFVQLLDELDWTLIDIPEEEFATQGTNVLALAPGKVLMLKENTGTRRLLEDAGCEVPDVYTGERPISTQPPGGPTLPHPAAAAGRSSALQELAQCPNLGSARHPHESTDNLGRGAAPLVGTAQGAQFGFVAGMLIGLLLAGSSTA